jgi:hypothetical protein
MRRPRLTYANVVSTICLFAIVLGGGAYAASKISGTEIKSRSVAGKKLKKNTVTGKEVNEGKLGTVPNAANAERLGGLDAAAFLRSDTNAFIRSDRMAFGSASPAAPTSTVILSLPGLGVTLLTDGDADPDHSIVLRNDRAPGGGSIEFTSSSLDSGTLNPGGTITLDAQGFVDFLSTYVADGADRSRAALLECRRPATAPQIGCFALLSPNAPG